MYSVLQNRLDWLIETGHAPLLRGGKKGIEKEGLRVLADGTISQRPHPSALGSALTHPAITTDFSEALLELITPPFAEIRDAIDYLDTVHRFVYANMAEDEVIWATSMPCIIHGESSIPIGNYGTSNVGMMKQIYRRGLQLRYGSTMQAISGVHFNYSVPEEFWPIYQEEENDDQSIQDFVSTSYLAMARNVLRHEWLITYLFGNSPALCKSFIGDQPHSFQDFDAHTYFEPHATSLRMSDIGYKNNGPENLRVSYNSLGEYIFDLTKAIETPHPPYQEKGVVVDGQYLQLNANILQIENEYYSAIRPKQVTNSGEKPTNALRERGVRYVELRSLDVSATDAIGVNETQLRFLEAFLLFCLLHESPPLLADEQVETEQNQQQTASNGRGPSLTLLRHSESVLLTEWASEIFEQMQPICELLDDALVDGSPYATALTVLKTRIDVPTETPSAQMIQEMTERTESFSQYGMRVSHEHAATLRSTPLDAETNAQMQTLASESVEKQRQIEANDVVSFDNYLAEYFAQ